MKGWSESAPLNLQCQPKIQGRRTGQPHRRQSDWDALISVGLFERHALGNVSAKQLEAETGLAATRIRLIFRSLGYTPSVPSPPAHDR
jgi:hypothetical protein